MVEGGVRVGVTGLEYGAVAEGVIMEGGGKFRNELESGTEGGEGARVWGS
jgi:hypothetical protein